VLKRSVLAVVIVVLAMLAVSCGGGSTPTTTAVVKGSAVDAASGAVLAGIRIAAVTAGSSGDGTIPVGTPEATTAADGTFRIEDAPEGKVDLVVRPPQMSDPTQGYSGTRVRLSLSEAAETSVTVRLLPVTVSVLSIGIQPTAVVMSSDSAKQFSADLVTSSGTGYSPTWTVEGAIGTIDAAGNFAAGGSGEGLVRATLGASSATTTVSVTNCVIAAEPDYIRPGDQASSTGTGSEAVEVIVGYHAGASGASARSDTWSAVDTSGGYVVEDLPIANAALAVVPADKIESLRSDWRVAYIEPNSEVHLLDPVSPPAGIRATEGLSWNIENIRADKALQIDPTTFRVLGRWAGDGVRVGVVDTGISDSHGDLVVAGGTNIINPRASWRDDNGHGTFASGIIGARDNGVGIIGIAPHCDLYAVKVLDLSGNGRIDDVISGIQWCVEHGIRVINLSLGITTHSLAVKSACDAAWNGGKGAILAAASGNNEPVVYPANYGSVISVGATTRFDQIAPFSSEGPPVELCAPGESVYSCALDGAYRQDSGTSFAAPHVSGLAALLFSTGRYSDAAHLRQHMRNSIVDLGTPGRDEAFGYGKIDAKAAIDSPGCADLLQ
jgi:hypothetical protein